MEPFCSHKRLDTSCTLPTARILELLLALFLSYSSSDMFVSLDQTLSRSSMSTIPEQFIVNQKKAVLHPLCYSPCSPFTSCWAHPCPWITHLWPIAVPKLRYIYALRKLLLYSVLSQLRNKSTSTSINHTWSLSRGRLDEFDLEF